MQKIRIPNNWEPRSYQHKLWTYLERGGKRAIAVWHRRSGKDDVCLNWTCYDAIEKPGTYWYMLPEASQARKAIWEAVNPHTGRRRIDEAFPKEIRSTTREQEMMIKLINGSTWQVVGSDNYDSLVGSPPRGVVFSEWPMSRPASWAYLRPILLENGGWAIFNGTPRGENHAYTMFEAAREDPDWFAELLTVDDTGVFEPEMLMKEQAEYVREHGDDVGTALFQQEYYCSFQAAIVGAYYAREMVQAERDGRIAFVPYDPSKPVDTAWDMGKGSNMAVGCVQQIGLQHRWINCVTGVDSVPEAITRLKQNNYTWGRHFMPHDAEPSQIGSGRSMKETAQSLGFKDVVIVPQGSVADGINATRLLLPACAFDKDKCEPLTKALKHYKRKWDDVRNTYLPNPHHDWASHFADMMRTYAMGYEPESEPLNYHALYRKRF